MTAWLPVLLASKFARIPHRAILDATNALEIAYPQGLFITHLPSKGRGVITKQSINAGASIETSPCIVVPADEYKTCIRKTVFENYLFTGINGEHLLALGIGSLFNHSSRPNLDYRVDKLKKTVTFRAARDIKAGEELTFFYGSRLWFEDAEAAALGPESCQHDHMDNEDLFLSSIDV